MLQGRIFGRLEVNQPSRFIHPNLRTGRPLHGHQKERNNVYGGTMKADARKECNICGETFSLNLTELLVSQNNLDDSGASLTVNNV